MSDFEKLLRSIKGLSLQYYGSDADPGKKLTLGIAQRDEDYTELLENHIKFTRRRGRCKEIHKWIFFWLIVGAGIVGIVYVIRIFNKILSANEISVIIEAIPVIITALVTFVSTILAIPLTIAKFLFNTKEDDNITTLIQHTQDHDTAGITIFKERFLSGQDKSTNSSKIKNIDSDE